MHINIECSIALDLLALVFLATLILTQKYKSRREHLNRQYITISVCICVFLLIDAVYMLLYGSTDPFRLSLLKALKSFYFILNSLLVWLWGKYADTVLFGSLYYVKKYRHAYTVILLVNLLLVVVNIPTGFLFDISESGAFIANEAGMWLFTLLNYASLILVETVLLLNRGLIRRDSFAPLLLFPLPPLLGETLQLFTRSCSLICAYSISALLIYQVSQNNTIYTDELTGLANRRMLNDTLRKWFSENRTAMICGILLDLDNLKLINDTYGHLCGDDALLTMAEIINEINRKGIVAARFGGDEFVLIWLSKDGNDIPLVMQELQTQKEKINSTKPEQARVEFSMGEFCCREDEHCTAEDFVRSMDDKMYAQKSDKKQPSAIM